MKILFLCKKKYMRKDVIDDRYGRLYELPAHLSENHDVRVIATDYRPAAGPGFLKAEPNADSRVQWHSVRMNFLIFPTLFYYLYLLYREYRNFQPDLIIGASDCLHTGVAVLAGQLLGVRVLLDLYDNYEVFGLTRVPGLGLLYRYSVRNADLVTCVSGLLQEHVRERYRPEKPVYTIESTVDKKKFYPVDKETACNELGLDPGGVYIGSAGALYRERGIRAVYDAFLQVNGTRSDVKLLLAGETDPDCLPPDHPDVVYIGELDHDRMNSFYNSLDVAFIYMRDDDFGRYSFPQKAFEILACNTPVLCASVCVFPELFRRQQEFLYEPENVDALIAKILHLLDHPHVPEVDIPDWKEQTGKLDAIVTGRMN